MIESARLQDVPKLDNPHGVDARKLHDSEHAQVIHIELAPGGKLLRHSTPVDVVFFVIEGSAVIEIGDERVEAIADTLIESPAKIPHRVMNGGDGTLRFLVIKTPRPTQPTRILG
ncbi:cupin domain-containing protein [bacterium]|nr:cupin domain-containing protein [bacterium]